jgi:hypothetical protein
MLGSKRREFIVLLGGGGLLLAAKELNAQLGCSKGRVAGVHGHPKHQVTRRQQATTSLAKLRPQPHSQVMDNGIATSSGAVDLS